MERRRRRPLGVVGLITPWNFPAAIPAWKTAPALAYGNTVVLKLAQDAPLTGLQLARALAEALFARRSGLAPCDFEDVAIEMARAKERERA